MKSINKKFSATIATLLISCTLLLANTTDVYVHVLTENDWQTIEANAEMDAMLDLREIPAITQSDIHVLTEEEWADIRKEVELERMTANLNHTDVVYTTLTEAEWNRIMEQAELDAMLDI